MLTRNAVNEKWEHVGTITFRLATRLPRPSHDRHNLAQQSPTLLASAARGVAQDGRMLKPPMAWVYAAGLKAADLADIVANLQMVPPLQ